MSGREIVSPIPYVKRSRILHLQRRGSLQKMFLVEFSPSLEVLTTLEGFRKVRAVGNVNLHPSLWAEEWTVGSLTATAAEMVGLAPHEVAFLFTGVDMDKIAFSTQGFGDLLVWVAATAGVRSNAMRAGVDEGKYLQRHGRWERVGTVNIMVFVNRAMTPGAMTNAIIGITEAKTGVFQDLKIRSSYSPHLQATGTGTDNVMVVAGETFFDPITSAGGHTKVGELIARGVREAVARAIENQKRV